MNPQLSARELSIVRLIAVGKSNKMMAAMLSISEKTIVNHRMRIYVKLRVHCTADCIRAALKQKLITIDDI
jgi:DNA-binding NarL/FixJ family response regulator